MQPSKEISFQTRGTGCPPSRGVCEVLSPHCTFCHCTRWADSSLEAMSLLQVTFYFIIYGFASCHLQHCFLCQFTLFNSWQFFHLPVIALCCCVQPSRSKFLLWRFCTQTWLPAFVIPFPKHEFILKHRFSLKCYHIFKCRLQCTLFINV